MILKVGGVKWDSFEFAANYENRLFIKTENQRSLKFCWILYQRFGSRTVRTVFIPPSIILPWFPPTGRIFLMCTRSVSFLLVGDRGIVRQLHAAPPPSPFFLQNQSFLLPHPLLCILLLLRPPPVAQLSLLHKRRKKGCSLLDLVIAPRPMRNDPSRLLPLTTKVFATVAQQHHTGRPSC